ncbi:MAG: nucleotidyltransferase family protein [Gemmatimonadota bacterium]|nr:nucleotidyltransferase family protein [Gemmatimonadota bacterium]
MPPSIFADPMRPDERSELEAALRLRHWALEVFNGHPETEPPAGRAEALAFVLSMEACALPLRRRLEESRGPALPEVLTTTLDVAVRTELQQVLAAREQLATVAALAREHGWRVIVLKGGTLVHSDRPLALGDVDVLLARAEASLLADELDARGYAVRPAGGLQHLPARWTPGSAPVEIHHRLFPFPDEGELLRRSVTLGRARGDGDSLEGLRRLHPVDELRHVLAHDVLRHPRLRGRLRGLVLAARVLERCEAADVEAVRGWIADAEEPEPLASQLRAAERIASWPLDTEVGGRETPAQIRRDPFPEIASRRYVAGRRAAAQDTTGAYDRVLDRAVDLACSELPVTKQLARDLRYPSTNPSRAAGVRRLEESWPALARPIRALVRVGRFAAAAALARRIRREASRLKPHSPTPAVASRSTSRSGRP